jgi:ankyrin repeat protein
LPKEHLHLSNLDGNTPLHWAALTGNLEAVKLLLDNGADGKVKIYLHINI